jgi:hypothetical protein
MKAGGFDFDFGQIRKGHWDSDTKAVTVVIGKLCIKIWIKRIEPTAETDSLGRIVICLFDLYGQEVFSPAPLGVACACAMAPRRGRGARAAADGRRLQGSDHP